MAEELGIIVLEGDETGSGAPRAGPAGARSGGHQGPGLLRALRPLARQPPQHVQRGGHPAAEAMREAGFALKAATVTPEGADDVGSPNRLLREAIDGKVIIRTGRRIPGVTPVAGVHYPIAVVRMAVGDAYGAEQWRARGERRRGGLSHRAHHRAASAARWPSTLPHRRADPRARLRRPQVDRQPGLRGDAQGGDGRRPPSAIPRCPTAQCSSTPPTPG